MKQFLFIGCLLLTTSLFAQREETLFGSNGLNLSGAWGGWTTSMTKFGDDFAVLTGGFGGLEFGRTFLVGWGNYKLINDVEFSAFPSRDFEMRYNGLMIGYMLKADKAIHPTFNILAGKGKVELSDANDTDKIFVVQPSVGIELNVLRWFHIDLQGGYRFVTDTDITGLTDTDLSAPYGEIKLKFGFSWGR